MDELDQASHHCKTMPDCPQWPVVCTVTDMKLTFITFSLNIPNVDLAQVVVYKILYIVLFLFCVVLYQVSIYTFNVNLQ